MRLAIVLLGILLVAGCGKEEYFGNFLPFATGNVWTFEDENGNRAEISIYGDSLSGYKDTIFKVFFLGNNMDFLKTPNYVSWRWYRTIVVNDKEIELENKYYPFFEMPFISGEKRTIENNAFFSDEDVYYHNMYSYEFDENENAVNITINSRYYTVIEGDTTHHEVSYIFTVVRDTGFKEITYIEDTTIHHFSLVGFQGG